MTYNRLAIVALALSVLGALGFFAVHMLLSLISLAAAVLAVIAIRQIRARGDSGRWAATTAFIVGALTVIAAVLLLIGLAMGAANRV